MSRGTHLQPDDRPGLAPHVRLQWEEVQQAWVVLYPKGNVSLNESAGDILRLCTGEKTVAEIIAALQGDYAGEDLTEDIQQFLEIACGKKWIEARHHA